MPFYLCKTVAHNFHNTVSDFLTVYRLVSEREPAPNMESKDNYPSNTATGNPSPTTAYAPSRIESTSTSIIEVPTQEDTFSTDAAAPPMLRFASNVAYTSLSAVIVIGVAVAIIVTIVWFVSDLTSIHTQGMTSGAVRNQVINVAANFLANLAMILVLIEVVTSLVLFIQTRRASARPLLLIPLFVVMRGVILITNQLITSGISTTNEIFFKLLAQMGAFALVGLFISLALAAIRDPLPKTNTVRRNGKNAK